LPPNAAHSTQAKHHQRQKEMNGNIQRTYTKQYQQKKKEKKKKKKKRKKKKKKRRNI